jgi:hypothetical protein
MEKMLCKKHKRSRGLWLFSRVFRRCAAARGDPRQQELMLRPVKPKQAIGAR